MEKTKPKQVLIPAQKTFSFTRKTPDPIKDHTINQWLEARVKDGKSMPTLGKVAVGLFRVYYVYFYIEQLD